MTYNSKGEVEGVKYDRIGVVLINAVKEQQAQIDGFVKAAWRAAGDKSKASGSAQYADPANVQICSDRRNLLEENRVADEFALRKGIGKVQEV